MNTEQTLLQQLIALLVTVDGVGTARERRGFITHVGLTALQPRIDLDGAPFTFVTDLLSVVGRDGRDTFDLFLLRLARSPYIGGLDRQAELNALIMAANALPDDAWRRAFATPDTVRRPLRPVLPAPPEQFIGRADDLAYYREKLITYHLAVITGMAGIGKTSLALRLAAEFPEPERVFWHQFMPAAGVDRLIDRLAEFLAWHGRDALWQQLQLLARNGGQRPSDEAVLAYLLELVRGGDFVLCLDDFHHADDDPTLNQLVDRLRTVVLTGELTVIITSRRMPAFVQLVEFDPLDGLIAADVRALLQLRGIELTEAQATRLHQLTGGNAEFVTLASGALLAGQEIDDLFGRMAESDDVRRYLIANVNQFLNLEERRVMEAVAVLSGYPGARDIIEYLLDGVNVYESLHNLVWLHLLWEQPTGYRQHDIVQAFYYDYTSPLQRRRLHRRAARFYQEEQPDTLLAGHHLQRAGDSVAAARVLVEDVWSIINQGQAQVCATLLQDIDVSASDRVLALDVALALAQVWDFIGRHDAARANLDKALALHDLLADGTEHDRRFARICLGYGDMLVEENPAESAEWLRRGLANYDKGDTLLTASLHLELGSALHKTGDFDEAREHVEACLALVPPGPSQLRMQALRELGVSAFFTDDLNEAVTHTQAALVISEALHDQFAKATLLSNLGIWRFEQGNWVEGVAAFEVARQTCEMIGSEKLMSDIELNLGIARGDAGESEKSRSHLLRSLDLAQKTGNELVAMRANSVLARGYLKEGDIDAAYNYAQTALDSAEAQGNELLRMMVLAVLAEINLKAGQLPSAQLQIEYALESAEMLGMADSVEAGVYLHQLGRVKIASGAFEEARVTLDRSLTLVAGEDPLAEAETQATYGKLLLEMGQYTRARAMLAEAATTFEQIGADEQLHDVRNLLQHESGEVSYEQT